MYELPVLIDSLDKIKNFVRIISEYNEDMDLVRGTAIVDAKSIMGIFAMDLSQPVLLKVYGSEQCYDEICKDLEPYACKVA